MKTKGWMEFILESQRCECCGSDDLSIKKQRVSLNWSKQGREDQFVVYFTPLLDCGECGHAHISNAVLGTLREQFLVSERIVEFDYKSYQKRLSGLSAEEQWVEENYYFSTAIVDCGFEIKTSGEEEERKPFNQTMEVNHG